MKTDWYEKLRRKYAQRTKRAVPIKELRRLLTKGSNGTITKNERSKLEAMIAKQQSIRLEWLREMNAQLKEDSNG